MKNKIYSQPPTSRKRRSATITIPTAKANKIIKEGQRGKKKRKRGKKKKKKETQAFSAYQGGGNNRGGTRDRTGYRPFLLVSPLLSGHCIVHPLSYSWFWLGGS